MVALSGILCCCLKEVEAILTTDACHECHNTGLLLLVLLLVVSSHEGDTARVVGLLAAVLLLRVLRLGLLLLLLLLALVCCLALPAVTDKVALLLAVVADAVLTRLVIAGA